MISSRRSGGSNIVLFLSSARHPGLRLAAVYAPIGAIIGEWVGASKGLGYLMLLANGRAKTDLMFAALIVLAVFTIALHAAVHRFAERVLER